MKEGRRPIRYTHSPIRDSRSRIRNLPVPFPPPFRAVTWVAMNGDRRATNLRAWIVRACGACLGIGIAAMLAAAPTEGQGDRHAPPVTTSRTPTAPSTAPAGDSGSSSAKTAGSTEKKDLLAALLAEHPDARTMQVLAVLPDSTMAAVRDTSGGVVHEGDRVVFLGGPDRLLEGIVVKIKSGNLHVRYELP